MPKRRRDEDDELIPGVPMRSALRFLCKRSHVFDLPHQDRDEREEQFAADFSFTWEFGLERRGRKEAKAVEAADILEAMISRGWIDRVPLKNPNYNPRFRVTDAGKKLAAEFVHLFKWPATKSQVAPTFAFSVRMEPGAWLRYLIELHEQLARLGSGLTSDQREMLNDLEAGLDEEALAKMLDWWNYQIEPLVARGKHARRPGRPRIEVAVDINQRGNFIAKWEPVGLVLGQPTEKCDWVHWRAHEHRHVSFELSAKQRTSIRAWRPKCNSTFPRHVLLGIPCPR